MTNVVVGLLIILGILAILAVFWFICWRINIRLTCYRKYKETKARMRAIDESKLPDAISGRNSHENDGRFIGV